MLHVPEKEIQDQGSQLFLYLRGKACSYRSCKLKTYFTEITHESENFLILRIYRCQVNPHMISEFACFSPGNLFFVVYLESIWDMWERYFSFLLPYQGGGTLHFLKDILAFSIQIPESEIVVFLWLVTLSHSICLRQEDTMAAGRKRSNSCNQSLQATSQGSPTKLEFLLCAMCAQVESLVKCFDKVGREGLIWRWHQLTAWLSSRFPLAFW